MPSSVTAMRTVTPGLGPASRPSSAVNSTPAQMAPNTATGLKNHAMLTMSATPRNPARGSGRYFFVSR